MSDALHYLIVAGIFWAVVCRALKMDEDTRTSIKARYGVLLLGAVFSLPVYGLGQIGQVLLGGSVLVHLWLDASRWRHGVPR